MEHKILIVYASTHGAAKETAEVVAEELRGLGAAVDLRAAREVASLAGYTGVVIGAALYLLHLHKDALRFLARHQTALRGLPVAVFAGGPWGEAKPDDWQEVRRELDADLAAYPWLKPVSIQVIGGRHDPKRLRFPWKFVPALRNMPASDLRDWVAIRAWARGLFEQMTAVPA